MDNQTNTESSNLRADIERASAERIAQLEAERNKAQQERNELAARLLAQSEPKPQPAPQPDFVPPPQARPASNLDWVKALQEQASEFKATFVLPSWSRGIITVAVMVALGVGFYMGGAALVAFFAAGAASMSIPAFFTWIITFCTWAVVIYLGGKYVFKAGSYFLQKRVDADIAKVRDGINHALTSPPKYAVPVYQAA